VLSSRSSTYTVQGWVALRDSSSGRVGLVLSHPAEICSRFRRWHLRIGWLQFSFGSNDRGRVTHDCLYGGWGLSTGSVDSQHRGDQVFSSK
jgi:hypothetical protein